MVQTLDMFFHQQCTVPFSWDGSLLAEFCEAVGLTAAVARALGDAGISVSFASVGSWKVLTPPKTNMAPEHEAMEKPMILAGLC